MNRSEAAFAELVERHLPLVYSTALRQVGGDAHLAQDIAQTVFAALARKGHTLSDRASLAGWLYLGAHHAAAHVVRGEQRRRVREQEAQTMEEIFSNDGSEADWDRVRPVLDVAMGELSDADREAVLLRYFERRPFAEIGAALKLSEDAARMRVDRALDKLRQMLGRRGITSTTAALAAALGTQAVVAAPAGLAATISGAAFAGGVATAGATGLAAGIFMTKTSITLGAVALLALGSAVYFFTEARNAEAATAEAVRARDEARAKLMAAEQRANQSEQKGAALKRDLDGLFANKPASMAVASNRGGGGEKFTAAVGSDVKFYAAPAPADKTEAQRQLRERRAANLDATYQALFRQLRLTPEQIERFKTVKLDGEEKSGDLFRRRTAEAKAIDPSIDRSGLQKVFDQTNLDNRAETLAILRDTFGDTIAQEIQRYESALPVRPMANELATSLFYSDAPLTADQAERLIDIMAHHSRTGSGKVDVGAMNALAVLTDAEAVLSSAQMPAFRQLVTKRMEKQVEEERRLDRLVEPKVRAAVPK
jgi:RNA polymerase sigma factor (sigma-70 family)